MALNKNIVRFGMSGENKCMMFMRKMLRTNVLAALLCESVLVYSSYTFLCRFKFSRKETVAKRYRETRASMGDVIKSKSVMNS